MERLPLTDADAHATGGEEFTEDEQEIVLTEERPVVAEETRPVEQVRLGKEQEVAQQTISAEVRTERVEVEGTDDIRR